MASCDRKLPPAAPPLASNFCKRIYPNLIKSGDRRRASPDLLVIREVGRDFGSKWTVPRPRISLLRIKSTKNTRTAAGIDSGRVFIGGVVCLPTCSLRARICSFKQGFTHSNTQFMNTNTDAGNRAFIWFINSSPQRRADNRPNATENQIPEISRRSGSIRPDLHRQTAEFTLDRVHTRRHRSR